MIKITIKEILETSSLAYLLSPIRSKRILIKIIWILFLILFLFLSAYYVFVNIIDYLRFETTTSIYTINEKQSQFPTVTFCSKYESDFKIKLNEFWFNSKNLLNDSHNHLETYKDSFFGKCYKFNSNKKSNLIKYSKKSGYLDGLWMQFYSNTSHDFGSLYVYIHNHTIKPTTIYNKGYYISAGVENYFILNRINDQKLEYPYNDCLKDVSQFIYNKTIIEYFYKNNWEYTQKECINLCRNLKYKEESNCNCLINSLDEEVYLKCYYDDSDNTTITNCVDNYFSSFNIDSCIFNYCPLECDSFTYDITLNTQIILAQGNISDDYFGFHTYENMSKTFYGIYVYYEDLKYTLISQQAKIELFGLISNIGGTLGLFIGFSFISLLELFEICFEFLFYLLFLR